MQPDRLTEVSPLFSPIEKIKNVIKICHYEAKHFRAGNLKNCLKFWHFHCHDPSIIRLVSGLKVPLKQIPERRIPPPIKFSAEEKLAVSREISKFLLHNIIEPVFHYDRDEFLSCPEKARWWQ